MNLQQLEKTMVIERMIRHEEQGLILEVPFDMPLGIEQIDVRYEVEALGGDLGIIDLGIKDAEGPRGWSGGARNCFHVGLETSTPGYVSGELAVGAGWAVLLGAYKVPADGCRVTLTLDFEPIAPRWLKGDLHTHSEHSDGSFTLEEKLQLVEEAGLDFVALTDHNTVSQNLVYPRASNVVVIPGMELTTYTGHCNLLGVERPLQDFRAATKEQLAQRIAEAKQNGAKVVMNHPHCSNCGWHWGFDADYDWVEIWNGPWRSDNNKTLEWWQNELASGRKLVAVGGSDVHRPEPHIHHGTPTTWVYSETRTMASILDAINQGRVFISHDPEGPTMELTSGAVLTGGSVTTVELEQGEVMADRTIEFQFGKMQPGDVIKLFSDLGEEERIQNTNEGDVSIVRTVGERIFYRAEIWRVFPEVGQEMLACVGNPIYFEHK